MKQFVKTVKSWFAPQTAQPQPQLQSLQQVPEDTSLQAHFAPFAAQVIGQDSYFDGPYGRKRILYADWTASGRLYQPIEQRLIEQFGPYVANTHTETSLTGYAMTEAYHHAKTVIKRHVNANSGDVLVATGTGCTGAINKLQRILGLRIPSSFIGQASVAKELRPVVLITHMEHHSNHTSWLECEVDLEIIPATADGLVDITAIPEILARYADRPLKIASITGCSNVTGIATPYHDIAELMHRHGGLCFVDFACSAPYVSIDMHPANPLQELDAIYFSPHKFLGGPGSSGILLFNEKLYCCQVPDHPGGGTVTWTNPWQQHQYYSDIETREDGGTPGFLQVIRTALAIELKQQMGVNAIKQREAQIVEQFFASLAGHPNVVILAEQIRERLPLLSFYIPNAHFNLVVRLLNDRFGIQARGGCSCAGTYGHMLLNVDRAHSKRITDKIDEGDLTEKPGWIRVSFHPVMTDAELDYVCDAIKAIAEHWPQWADDYVYLPLQNDYAHKTFRHPVQEMVENWFTLTPLN